MPLGPRKRSPDMRDKQGKIVNPKGGSCVDEKGVGPAVGTTKQYKQSGKKYSGPNYKQKDPNVEKFGSK